MNILVVRFILIVGLLVVAFCAPTSARSSDEPLESASPKRAVNAAHPDDAEQVISLIARSKALQDKIPSFVKEASLSIAKHKGALPATCSVRIGKAMSEANAIRAALFHYALLYRNALYRVDDGMVDGERIDSILLSMSAALTLFDNSQFMRKYFSDDNVLCNKLNEAYPEYGVGKNFYADSLLRANSLTYRTGMSDAIRFFQDNQEVIACHISKSDKSFRTLYEFVEKSPARKQLGGDDAFRQITRQIVYLLKRTASDSVHQVGKLKFVTSRIMGNTMGMVRWRAGKLKNDQEFLALMSAGLEPGDILLEKTPFALTDKTIPGHFGHAAIYIGTTDQLQAIGALDLPLTRELREQIDSGHVVLEALRGGVVLNTLEHFMNIDDVAVLRPKELSLVALRDSIGLALGNYGKSYDFNFDVNTTETIVCSELVYVAFPQIDFVTTQVFTSFTISPDDIARQASGNPSAPLELTLFAHDGKLVYRKGDDARGIDMYLKLVGLQDEQRQSLLVDE